MSIKRRLESLEKSIGEIDGRKKRLDSTFRNPPPGLGLEARFHPQGAILTWRVLVWSITHAELKITDSGRLWPLEADQYAARGFQGVYVDGDRLGQPVDQWDYRHSRYLAADRANGLVEWMKNAAFEFGQCYDSPATLDAWMGLINNAYIQLGTAGYIDGNAAPAPHAGVWGKWTGPELAPKVVCRR